MPVSVIVPVYNDPEGLTTTLESLIEQTASTEKYEILPVNNNSTDDTATVIQKFENKYPDLIRGFEENNIQSSYAARNKGIEEARGDTLCFIDADMIVPNDYISKVSEKTEDVDYFGCNVKIFAEKSSLAGKYDKSIGFNVELDIKEGNFAPTCCLVINKTLINDVGKFDDQMFSGGDVEFGKRVHDAGYKQRFAEDIKLKHPARTQISELISKSKRVGKGMAQMNFYHPEQSDRSALNPRNFLPPKPFGFGNIFRGWESKSLSEKIQFYFLHYLLKLIENISRLKWKIKFSWLRS